MQVVAPNALAKLVAHDVQSAVPTVALYFPPSQSLQVPENPVCPAGQLSEVPTQCDSNVEPAGEVLPTGHAVHCDGHLFKHSLQHFEHTPSLLQYSLELGLLDTEYIAHTVLYCVLATPEILKQDAP
jgi:hypothetical protein